jgi:hypothetical protein
LVWIAAKRIVSEGPPVIIDCPACHASGATAVPRLYEEPLLLLHLVPLFTLRSAFVKCGVCHQSLSIATRDLSSLRSLSPKEISRLLRPYVSGVGRFLVLSALFLFWFPFLAPALSLGGLWMTRRHSRWRRLAIVSVILSFAVAGAVAVLLVSTAGK